MNPETPWATLIGSMKERVNIFQDYVQQMSESERFTREDVKHEIRHHCSFFTKWANASEFANEPVDYFLNTIFNECNEIVSVDKRADVWLQIEEQRLDQSKQPELLLKDLLLRWRKGDDGEFWEELEIDYAKFKELYRYIEQKDLSQNRAWTDQEIFKQSKQSATRRTTFYEILQEFDHDEQLNNLLDNVLSQSWTEFLWKILFEEESRRSSSINRPRETHRILFEVLNELPIKISESKRKAFLDQMDIFYSRSSSESFFYGFVIGSFVIGSLIAIIAAK